MQEDFVKEHGGDSDPNRRDYLRYLYKEVLSDLLLGVSNTGMIEHDEEGLLLRRVAAEGIRYAREFTYSIVPHLARTRISTRRDALSRAIDELQKYRAEQDAHKKAAREAADRLKRPVGRGRKPKR